MTQTKSVAAASTRLEQGDSGGARALMGEHVKLYPEAPDGLLLKGMLLVQRGSFREAEADFRAVVRLAANNLLSLHHVPFIQGGNP